MKDKFSRWVALIDSKAQRERVMIYLVACGVVVLGIDRGLLEPLFKQRQEAEKAIAEQNNRLANLEKQILEISNPSELEKASGQRLEDINRSLSTAEQQLQGAQEKMVAPERMAGLLEEMLQRNRQVKLLSLRTLPEPPSEVGKEDRGSLNVGMKGLYTHGLEVVVEGAYLDLAAYLADLEALPQRMYWAEVIGEVENYPVTRMKIRLYTLSLDKAWLKL